MTLAPAVVALLWVAATALLIALPLFIPGWRLKRALKRPLPRSALALLERNLPAYAGMPVAMQRRMQQLVVQFLFQKKFIGCGGLVLDDEMRVTIAAHACLLLLNRPGELYPGLHSILVYPGEFLVPRDEIGPGGVVTRRRQGLLGESWDDGRVVLSWEHVQAGAMGWTNGQTGAQMGGQNVVLHEFAHQLDSESGPANGAPILGGRAAYRRWSEVFSQEYESLRYQAHHGEQGVLDHYGASSPAEFFAVATEAFFQQPYRMAQNHPALYRELQQYYRLEPRAWLPAPPEAEPGAAAATFASR
jgi:Mlc titration factor MtfA (ptsG expression regulator)